MSNKDWHKDSKTIINTLENLELISEKGKKWRDDTTKNLKVLWDFDRSLDSGREVKKIKTTDVISGDECDRCGQKWETQHRCGTACKTCPNKHMWYICKQGSRHHGNIHTNECNCSLK